MRRVISSGWTVVFKVPVPLFSVGLSVFLLLGLFHDPPQPLDNALGTFMMIVVTSFSCWFGARLKQVSIDEHNLYIAGFFKEISIPIPAIDTVSGFHNGSPVILRLKKKSEFGHTIFFLAKWRLVLPWETHPIFGQLRQLIRKNQVG